MDTKKNNIRLTRVSEKNQKVAQMTLKNQFLKIKAKIFPSMEKGVDMEINETYINTVSHDQNKYTSKHIRFQKFTRAEY